MMCFGGSPGYASAPPAQLAATTTITTKKKVKKTRDSDGDFDRTRGPNDYGLSSGPSLSGFGSYGGPSGPGFGV